MGGSSHHIWYEQRKWRVCIEIKLVLSCLTFLLFFLLENKLNWPAPSQNICQMQLPCAKPQFFQIFPRTVWFFSSKIFNWERGGIVMIRNFIGKLVKLGFMRVTLKQILVTLSQTCCLFDHHHHDRIEHRWWWWSLHWQWCW